MMQGNLKELSAVGLICSTLIVLPPEVFYLLLYLKQLDQHFLICFSTISFFAGYLIYLDFQFDRLNLYFHSMVFLAFLAVR